jgi:hypothetical protein
MRKLSLAIAAATMAVPVAMPAPAFAKHDGYYHGKTWKDKRGRLRCRKPDGTIGLIVGGAAGALVGREIDKHGDRTTGTVLGAAAGALLGREVARSRTRCR